LFLAPDLIKGEWHWSEEQMSNHTQGTTIGGPQTRWTAAFCMLAFLALPGLLTGKPAAKEEQAAKAFHVIASRFRFEPATIDVDEGDRVRLTLTSADVTHSLAIKALKVKAVIPEGGEEVTGRVRGSQARLLPVRVLGVLRERTRTHEGATGRQPEGTLS
jgi:heme/copper-type cytochrome/quinol oxidase subunit 2